jgi:hypothetical protein
MADQVDVPLTSVQKLEVLAAGIESWDAEGEMAMFLELARMALPHVRGMLPSDPAALDELLEQVGAFIAQLKSDPAALPAPTS